MNENADAESVASGPNSDHKESAGADVGDANATTSNAAIPATASVAANALHPIPSDTLKAAFKAFKKRLKITQLDNDSRVGRSPLTGGRSTVVSISPPNQYPTAVWDALVKEGKLRYAGQGMYELP